MKIDRSLFILILLVVSVQSPAASAEGDSLRDRINGVLARHAADGANNSAPARPDLSSPLRPIADPPSPGQDVAAEMETLSQVDRNTTVVLKPGGQAFRLSQLFPDFYPKSFRNQPYGKGGWGFQRGYPDGLVFRVQKEGTGKSMTRTLVGTYFPPAVPAQKEKKGFDPNLRVVVRSESLPGKAWVSTFGEQFPDYDATTGKFRRGEPADFKLAASGKEATWTHTLPKNTDGETVRVSTPRPTVPASQRQTVVLSFAGGFGSEASGTGERIFEKMRPSFEKTCATPAIHCIVYITNFIDDPNVAQKALRGKKPAQRLKVTKLDWGQPNPNLQKEVHEMSMNEYADQWKQNFLKSPSAVAGVYGHSWGGGLSYNLIHGLADLCAQDPKHCHHLLRSTLIDPVAPETTYPTSLVAELSANAPSLHALVKMAQSDEKVSILKKIDLAFTAEGEVRAMIHKLFNGMAGPHSGGLNNSRVGPINAMISRSDLNADPEKTVRVEYQKNFPFLHSHPVPGLDNHQVMTGDLVTLHRMLALLDKVNLKHAPEALDELLTLYENNAHSEIALDPAVLAKSSTGLTEALNELTRKNSGAKISAREAKDY